MKVNKILDFMQIKYQLKEDLKQTGGSMFELKEYFWRENNLESDLIQKVLNLNIFVKCFKKRNKVDRIFTGAHGENSVAVNQVEKEKFGNIKLADCLKSTSIFYLMICS